MDALITFSKRFKCNGVYLNLITIKAVFLVTLGYRIEGLTFCLLPQVFEIKRKEYETSIVI